MSFCSHPFLRTQASDKGAQSEGLQIPCAAAGVLAIKSIAAQCHFVPIPFYVRKRPTKVWKQKSKAVALLFIAESEGFEPPV